MAIADPKKYNTPKADDASGDTLQEQLDALQEQVAALLAVKSAPATSDDDRLEKILLRVAQMSADAHERAANPSNKTHPGVSVFSYPEGDRARPRPALKCEMFWCGYPVDLDTTTADEVELLNVAEPGEYTFERYNHTRKSPSTDTLTITGTRDGAGKLTRLVFTFPTIVHENRDTSQVAILQTAFGIKTPEQIELDTLRAEVARLMASEAVPA